MSSPPALDGLLGAVFIGIVLSTIIYGITCLQVYLYYTKHCRDDGRGMKVYVSLLLGFDTLHVALLAITYYYYTVTHFGDFGRLQGDTWSLSAQNTVGGILSAMTQFFFAYRLYNLSGKLLWLPIAICVISLVQTGCSAAYTAVGYMNHYFDASQKALPYVTAGLIADIVCDSLIAASMMFFLLKKRTQFAKTNRVLNLLVTYALNTCLLTTVFTVICFIFWYTSTDTLIYAVFYWVLIRLYSCSLVSTLNTRDTIKHVLESGSHELFGIRSTTTVIPSEASSRRAVTSKGWADPRSLTVDIGADDINIKTSTMLNDVDADEHVALP
ncbi:uncharacterized protein B0H18DRAFT_668496 [Fomitopsis serialis]|uniref:uncharacterized protein n=1 Tax=Fomitopsis serialis TaxID=139415 RepID=UPI00200891A6|nr:uncharacterized protein B0H18DRAFT_668496 [Neoantrodia serialis]KAH9918455.1 hypothetical protein B0H18DRAFT_668496 [Neoantrodia serialis]